MGSLCLYKLPQVFQRYTFKKEILNSETHHNQSQSESQPVILKCKGLKMCLTSAPIEFQNKNEVT